MAHRLSEIGVGDAVLLHDLSMDSFVDNLKIRYESELKIESE